MEKSMSYKIIGDSCTDLTPWMKKEGMVTLVPLTLEVGGQYRVKDDEGFNQAEFLAQMKKTNDAAKSACPSPDAFMENFEGADEVFVITLSGKLSGSFNSAVLAKKIYLEEHPKARICIVDSKSASVGQTLIALKIKECYERKMSYPDILEEVRSFRDNLSTYFVLDSLDVLVKNGRVSRFVASFAGVLNIKGIMAGEDGGIVKRDQARGMKKALSKMAARIAEEVKDPENRILAIAHCNAKERAESVKEELLSLVKFKDAFIVDTAGVSSMYANDGGIIVAY